jgi:signal transduction histidine kinase
MRYISHEMRSPLNSVFMGLQLMQNDISGVITSTRRSITMLRKDTRLMTDAQFKDRKEKIQAAFTSVTSTMKDLLETCDMVKESANVALENLNDMLTFDKIDENKLLLEVEDLNVWTFASETVKPFNINAIKAQVSLTVECAEMDLDWMQRCLIKADRFKLNQVLRNFLSNALKFCSPSSGEVKVLVERRAVAGRLARPISSPSAEPIPISYVARVSVSDNGCGISEENQKKLFGKHVQFHAGLLQKGGGSGLGLWISKSKCPQYTAVGIVVVGV